MACVVHEVNGVVTSVVGDDGSSWEFTVQDDTPGAETPVTPETPVETDTPVAPESAPEGHAEVSLSDGETVVVDVTKE